MARSLGVVLVFVAALFAGCLDGSGDSGVKEFDPITVPAWDAGYTWAYDVTSSYHSTYAEDGRPVSDSESDTEKVTFSVLNASLDIDGQPAYLVRLSQNLDHPFFQGTLQALTKSDLAVAAYGYGDHYRTLERPVMVTHSGYAPPSPKDPCEGVTRLQHVDSEMRSPGLQFPLDDGQTWTGSWGEDGDMLFTYTTRVKGMAPVQVPAGIFPSVYVETTFEPSMQAESPYELPFEFKIRTESWYSPDVRYLTKMVVSAEASGSDPEGRFGPISFDYVSTMVLRDFSLTSGPAEAVQVVLEDDEGRSYAKPYKQYSIVADQPLPIEVGDEPVTLNLGLSSEGTRSYDGRITSLSEVPQTADIDHETHQVVWMVGRHGDWETPWQETTGDTLSLTLDRGGRYGVHAFVMPIKCGDYTRSQASGDVTTTVTKDYTVSVNPGLPATIKVGSFPVEPEMTSMRVEWGIQAATGAGLDRGRPVLVSPTGQRRELSSSPHKEYYLYPPGDWTLEWKSDQATLGDDWNVRIQISYDPWNQI